MLDFSLGELMLVALVALLVVGPKDFPVIMRKLGRWAGYCKGITDEFRAGFHSAMKDHGVPDIQSDLATIEEEMNFIRDQNGNLQRVYDISDFMEESKRADMKPKALSEQPKEPDNKEAGSK